MKESDQLNLVELAFLDAIDSAFNTGVTSRSLKGMASVIRASRSNQGAVVDFIYSDEDSPVTGWDAEYQNFFAVGKPPIFDLKNQFLIEGVFKNGRVRHIFTSTLGEELPESIGEFTFLGNIVKA